MDATRFDTLTRLLGRRGVLRAGLALAGAGSALHLVHDDTAAVATPTCDARPKLTRCRKHAHCCSGQCHKKKGKKKGKCRCSFLHTRCATNTDCCGHEPGNLDTPICGVELGEPETVCCILGSGDCFFNGFC